MLPSPQPQPNATGEQQGLPQPPSTQSTTRESLAQRATPKPSTSRQPQTEQTVGYQGTPESQQTVKDIMGDYPPRIEGNQQWSNWNPTPQTGNSTPN